MSVLLGNLWFSVKISEIINFIDRKCLFGLTEGTLIGCPQNFKVSSKVGGYAGESCSPQRGQEAKREQEGVVVSGPPEQHFFVLGLTSWPSRIITWGLSFNIWTFGEHLSKLQQLLIIRRVLCDCHSWTTFPSFSNPS